MTKKRNTNLSENNKRVEKSRSLTSFLIRLFIFAFLLNWFWETLQTPFYETMSGFSRSEKIYITTRAAFVDAVIILGIYALGAAATRRLRWAMNGGWKCYLIFALLGATAATIIEQFALQFDFWRYGEQMPIVPVLKVGLSPFLQLTLLAPAALRLDVWLNGSDKKIRIALFGAVLFIA